MKSSESTLLDFISSPILQYVQNSYAQKYNIAVLIQDDKGRPLTQVTLPEWLLKSDQSLQIFVDAQLRTIPDALRRGLLDGHVAYDSYFQGLWYHALVPLVFNREYLGICQVGYSRDSGSSAWQKHARACQDFLFEKNSHLYFQDPQPHTPTENLVLLAIGLQSQLQRLLDAGWHRRHARSFTTAGHAPPEQSEANSSSSGLITTRSFDVIEAEAAVVAMLHYGHTDEMVGLNFFSQLVYQKSKGVELLEFIEQQIPVSQYDLDLACKDGSPCPVMLSVVPQRNFNDEPVGYQFLFAGAAQSVATPAIKEKEKEEEPRERKPDWPPNWQREQLSELYDRVTRRQDLGEPLLQHVTRPLFVLDPVNRVLLWNQAMETLLSIPALAILENRFDQLLLDSSRALWYAWLAEFRLDPGQEDFIPQERLDMVDNKGRIVQSRIQMSKNSVLGQELITVTLLQPALASETAEVVESKPQPRHDYFSLSLADAPVYRPSAQVQQLRTLVGLVTRQIEHSLMNVSAPIETSLWTEQAGKKWRSSFGRFHHDLEAMMMMVRRLQYFALNFEYRPQLMPLHRLIRQAVGLQTQLFANPVQLHLDMSSEVGLIMGDVSLLQQAIDFVCQNALEALQVRGDVLIVRTRPATMPETGAAAILIEVLDNGPGIAEDILQQLFHPFVTTKTGERGYGLGLAAASGIIQRHEGILQVMTRAGLGTAVQILLPAPVLNKVALEMEAAEEPAAAGAQHLLLVDDEPFLLLIWKTALEQAGYVVYGAGTADEAFALFKKEKSKIKCAIIDVQLLDSSGTELAKKILPLKQIPIIMTSGLQPDGMTMSVIEASRGRFVLKPVGISKLLQVIKSVI